MKKGRLDTASSPDLAPDVLTACDPNAEWAFTHIGSVHDSGGTRSAWSATALPDGGLLVWGNGYTSRGFSDAWIARLDARGQVLWDEVIGQERYFDEIAAVYLHDNEIIALGPHSYNAYATDLQWLRVSLDTGALLDHKLLQGPGNDLLLNVFPRSDGATAVLLSRQEEGERTSQIWAVGLDHGGAIRWQNTTDPEHLWVQFSAVDLGEGQGFLVAGNRARWTQDNQLAEPLQPYVLRMDDRGKVLYRHAPSGQQDLGEGWGWHFGLLALEDGGALFVSDQTAQDAPNEDAGQWSVTRLTVGMTPLWTRTLPGRIWAGQLVRGPDEGQALWVMNTYHPAPGLQLWDVSTGFEAGTPPSQRLIEGGEPGEPTWLTRAMERDGVVYALSSMVGEINGGVSSLSLLSLGDGIEGPWWDVFQGVTDVGNCGSPVAPLVLEDGRVALVVNCSLEGGGAGVVGVWMKAQPCP